MNTEAKRAEHPPPRFGCLAGMQSSRVHRTRRARDTYPLRIAAR